MKTKFKLNIKAVGVASAVILTAIITFPPLFNWSVKKCDEQAEMYVTQYLQEASRIVQSRPAEESQDQFRTITTHDGRCIISVTIPSEAPEIDSNVIHTAKDVTLQNGQDAVVTVYSTRTASDKAFDGIMCIVSLGWIVLGLATMISIGIYDLCGLPEYANITVHKSDTPEIPNQQETTPMAVSTDVSSTDLEEYKEYLREYIDHLDGFNRKQFKNDITESVKKSLQTLRDILQFIENDDLATNSVVKLKNYLLPQYTKMVEIYCVYHDHAEDSMNRKYMLETKEAIIKSQFIFSSVLSDVVENNMLDCATDASVYLQVAAQNGMTQPVNTICK